MFPALVVSHPASNPIQHHKLSIRQNDQIGNFIEIIEILEIIPI